jgi:hypothetical protein
VQIKDVLGRQVSKTSTNITGDGQTQTYRLPGITGKGVYLIKILDHNNLTVSSKKILVQ